MQETTRTRLTIFSRLWAIPMILFILLCIVAVVACMEENTDLMGLAVLGTLLMFVIQLCQLVAAIVVRRWWCVAGGVIGLVVSLFVMVCSIVALAAGQYRPPVIYENNDTIDSWQELLVDSIEYEEAFAE